MRSRESKEDYLEAILVLRGLHGYCRNVDIAKHLGVTKPSVTNAVSNLNELGLVEISKFDISLTPEGKEIAERTYRKHEFFEDLLLNANVDAETAAREACCLEHCISQDTFEKLEASLAQYVSNKIRS